MFCRKKLRIQIKKLGSKSDNTIISRPTYFLRISANIVSKGVFIMIKSVLVASILSVAALGASAAGPMNDSVQRGATTVPGGPMPTSGEGDPSNAWLNHQWDKKHWDGMKDNDRMEYRKKHSDWWGKRTPEEKAEWRAKHKGRTNYMDNKWDK